MPDPVQEFIDRQNQERASRPNPFVPTAPAPRSVPAALASDPVGAYIWRRHSAAAGRPNPLLIVKGR